MEKNAILAIVLTGAIWLGWYFIFPPQQVKNTEQQAVKTEEKKAEVKTKAPEATFVESAPRQSAKVKVDKEATIEFKTSKFKLVLTNRGAAIKSAIYNHKDIELVIDKAKSTSGVLDFALHFDQNEFLNGGVLDNVLWAHEQDATGVRFYTEINYGNTPLMIEKLYHFTDKGNEIRVEYRLKNNGRKAVQFHDDMIYISPADSVGPTLDFSNTYNSMSSIYYLNGDYKSEYKGGGVFSGSSDYKKEPGQIGWAGVMSRYFLLIMLPDGFTGTSVVSDHRKDRLAFRTGLTVKMDALEPGKSVSKQFKVYMGEKDKEALGAMDKSLIDAADISAWIEPIRYFVIWSLVWLNKLFGNIGWSIVVFSIFTKLVFTPLTLKSTREMKRMHELTPKLNALKEKYKGNPELLNQKTMEFFKQNKYNPMGGCLPMLIQIPFFMALYSALANSLDLWNAPFILWMKDMSMPDTVAYIGGLSIQILPLIMVGTTFIQQKMTSMDAGGQQQKIMMMLMPVILLFAFWSMPSGLVLYWTLQNIFQIAQQFIANQMGKKKA